MILLLSLHIRNKRYKHTHTQCLHDESKLPPYHVLQVTQLKIETNQFAAAFRKRNNMTPPDQTARENSTAAESTQQSTSTIDRLSITPTEPHPNSCSQQSIRVNGLTKKSKPRSKLKEDDTRNRIAEDPSGI